MLLFAIATVIPEEAIINNDVPTPNEPTTSLYSINPNRGSKNINNNVARAIGIVSLIQRINAANKKQTPLTCNGSKPSIFDKGIDSIIKKAANINDINFEFL